MEYNQKIVRQYKEQKGINFIKKKIYLFLFVDVFFPVWWKNLNNSFQEKVGKNLMKEFKDEDSDDE